MTTSFLIHHQEASRFSPLSPAEKASFWGNKEDAESLLLRLLITEIKPEHSESVKGGGS
jgi:hypothetical protein